MRHRRRRRARRWSLRFAAKFVAKWEGFLSHAYLDTIANPPVWTIGFGHTGDVHPGEVVSREEAEAILARDLHDAAAAVARAVKVPITIRQRMALISIAFNCGPGVLEGTKLITALNARRYREAADHFLEWSHAGGVVVQGLLNRRRAERWMFLHPLHPRNPHRPRPIPRHP